MHISKGLMYSYLHHIKYCFQSLTRVYLFKGPVPFTDDQLLGIGYASKWGGDVPNTNATNLVAAISIPNDPFQLVYISPENWRVTFKSSYIGSATGNGEVNHAVIAIASTYSATRCITVSVGTTESAVLRLNKTSFVAGDSVSLNSFNFNIQRKVI